ncbi:hypothetical protein EDD16DRAFT_1522356 [Pisolithus croceorrhizus]|nr:hypothetical protein EDD16DRAFT_1522356 [Pisolithus croceorrhizus]KAI6119641.1 hypothetical protein EV401DRAFT_1888114 [Pisolithus croceorrhizus]KAI6160182.1 hypothetical protein EDD17DRAFT_1510728 [Pisolithus thermaeus]
MSRSTIVLEMWATTTTALKEVLCTIPTASEPVEMNQAWMKVYKQALAAVGSIFNEDAISRGLEDPVYPFSMHLAISNALPMIKTLQLIISYPETRGLPSTVPSEVQAGNRHPKWSIRQTKKWLLPASHHGDNEILMSQVNKNTWEDSSGQKGDNADGANMSSEHKCENASKVGRKHTLTPMHSDDIKHSSFHAALAKLLQGPIPQAITEHPENMAMGDTQELGSVEGKPQWVTALNTRFTPLRNGFPKVRSWQECTVLLCR